MHHDDPSLGRRERGKRERAARIAAAAATLFARRPFDEVSTAAIAREADVAEGTLFRYASSKTELLVMAFNTRFVSSLEDGLAAAGERAATDTVGRLSDLAAALLAAGADRPDNAALYQRELLFTTQAGAYVDQGVAIAALWEEALTAPFLALVGAGTGATTGGGASTAAGDAAVPAPAPAPSTVAAPDPLLGARLAGSAAWDALQLTAARRARRLGEAGASPDPTASGTHDPQADGDAAALAALTGQFELLVRGLRGSEVVTPTTPLR